MEAFEAVATAPGPVVFHCHAGKDRTGLVAALLLRLAGVAIEDIAGDYALSRIRLQPRHDQWLASAESEQERARIERITATPAAAMQAVLEAIDATTAASSATSWAAGSPPSAGHRARDRLRWA